MQPFKNYTIINFLHWMTINHPEIQRWADLMSSPEQLHQITEEFEQGDNPEKSYYPDQWFDNLGMYSHPHACGKNHVWEDPLQRYRRIPLHAIFLYTSMNHDIDSYIEENWCALHRISANSCDIHLLTSQFENDEDASDFIRNLKLIKDKHSIRFSELPGIFFWDYTGETEYISFSPDQSYKGIKDSISIIFDEIEKKPTIQAVRRAKRTLEKKETPQDLFKRLFPQTYSVLSLPTVCLTALAVSAAFASTGNNNPIGKFAWSLVLRCAACFC